MNINFKINKEEENVIVSDEKGTIETREYQRCFNFRKCSRRIGT